MSCTVNRVPRLYIINNTLLVTRFIIGKWLNASLNEQSLMASENDTYGDLVMLQQEENTNAGKSYHYIRWLTTASSDLLNGNVEGSVNGYGIDSRGPLGRYIYPVVQGFPAHHTHLHHHYTYY